eukprot:10970123-Ditylum_brightwellii.AAC.1
MSFRVTSIVHILLLGIFSLPLTSGNKNGTGYIPAGILFADKLSPKEELNKFTTGVIDPDVIQHEDNAREKGGGPLRFAITNRVPNTFFNSSEAIWEYLEDGTKVWRTLVEASLDSAQEPHGCKSFNFAFNPYQMPEGGKLIIYDPNSEKSIGPFTHDHNTVHGQLWTPIIPTCKVIIEVNLPYGVSQTNLSLQLASVNEGYRNFGQSVNTHLLDDQHMHLNQTHTQIENRGLAGYCNVNVKCKPDWSQEERSVAAFSLGGRIFCTGVMLNNVEQDYKPYFMTAKHCMINKNNAKSLVIYWNWKYDSCGGGTLSELELFTSGATFLASHGPSDATLLELNQRPDPRWR